MIAPVVIGDCTLYRGDCLEVLPTLGVGSVDAVVTDPPYGINFKSNGAKINRFDVIHGDTDFDLLPYWYKIYPTVKGGGAIYVYCRWDIAHEWRDIIVPDSQIIIPRGRVGMGDLDNYADEYEVVLFRRVGNHKINATELRIPNNSHAKDPPYFKRRTGNLWTELTSNQAWEHAEHPTQKTVASFKKMILISSSPGDLILDPFMGSGTTLVACVQTGRKGIGIEIDPTYFAIAVKRIKEAQLQMRMPI